MFERIRDQMGDLLTDDDLKKIIDVAMQKAFFEPQNIRTSGHYGRDIVVDPVFIVKLRELMSERVQVTMREYLDRHKDAIHDLITNIVSGSMLNLAMNYIEKQLGPSKSLFIKSALDDLGVTHGP